MRRLPLWLRILLLLWIISLGITVYQQYLYTPPKRGTIIRYEDFRGYKIPIKADGKGGHHPWYADVPWEVFTIQEKVSMAFQGGGLLSNNDIEEIKQRYGEK